MRTCPTCRTACDEEVETCPVDGTPLSAPDPLVGCVLGDRYRILARIGAGGMGTVYRAEHVVLRKRMAVKVLRPELSGDEDLVRRFQQEAIAASQIGQENIVDVMDSGRTPQGALYYVMEELEGATLATAVDSGPIDIPRALGLLVQICRALGAAHAHGIVHRDLKPDNVFLARREDGSEWVKVLDFGIAKSSSIPERGRVTRAGTVIGTPEYMAPEQGAAAAVDHRADVYALGVLAYEMLTGKVPFSADSAVATLLEHQARAPVPPRQLRPEIPEALESLVLKALEKRPAARQQDMNEIIQALNRVLEALGVPPVRGTPLAAPALPPDPAWVAGTVAVRRVTTQRGATLELTTPVAAQPLERDVAPAAPRRGRVFVAVVLTIALVVAAIAAATWVSSGASAVSSAGTPPADAGGPQR